MNERITILLFLVFTSVSSIFAQSVEDKKKMEIQGSSSIKLEEPLLNKETVKTSLPNEANPFLDAYPTIIKNNPVLTDFYRIQQSRLFKRFSVVGSGKNVSYTGLGEYISIHGAIRWLPSRKLSIDVGGLFSRQFYFASPLSRQDMMGVNAKIQYALTDNIYLNVWGQYIFTGTQAPFPFYNSLFPHTGVGASVSVDLKKDTEMSVGAEYQYDTKSQTWKPEYCGRVSIGF